MPTESCVSGPAASGGRRRGVSLWARAFSVVVGSISATACSSDSSARSLVGVLLEAAFMPRDGLHTLDGSIVKQ